MPSWLIL